MLMAFVQVIIAFKVSSSMRMLGPRIKPRAIHRKANRCYKNTVLGMSDTELHALPCRAWMWKNENKMRRTTVTAPIGDASHTQQVICSQSLCLSEIVDQDVYTSIVNFQKNGVISTRASDVPNLMTSCGSWSCDGNILKMVIDRTYQNGYTSKFHYVGIAKKNEDDEFFCIGGEICDEKCDFLDDNQQRKKFELSTTGPIISVTKVENKNENKNEQEIKNEKNDIEKNELFYEELQNVLSVEAVKSAIFE